MPSYSPSFVYEEEAEGFVKDGRISCLVFASFGCNASLACEMGKITSLYFRPRLCCRVEVCLRKDEDDSIPGIQSQLEWLLHVTQKTFSSSVLVSSSVLSLSSSCSAWTSFSPRRSLSLLFCLRRCLYTLLEVNTFQAYSSPWSSPDKRHG